MPWETELEMRREPFRLERIARIAQFVEHIVEILLDEIRQHEAIVQLGAPAREPLGSYGVCQNLAISARNSNCCVRLMRACGGISNARNSSRPWRPFGPSGEYSLSMQNSARCVLPVTSISRLRSNRSTSQGDV